MASRLRQAGHEVFTPTLTGLGERAHLLDPKINLETHIQDVLGVLQCEELSDAVLCGHSYGGMVITGVADQAPQKVRSLVYLDALVPEDGQRVLDLVPAETAAALQDSAKSNGTGFRVNPAPAEAFAVTPEDRAWVDRRCSDHPLRALEQPLRLTGQWKTVARKVYIFATGWSPGVGQPFFERAQEDAGWQAIALPCGHDVMIDKPQELSEILLAST